MSKAKTATKKSTTVTMPPLESHSSVPVPVERTEAGLMAIIERAANNPRIDVNKMQRLLDMHMQIQKTKAEIAYNAAMADCQGEIPQIETNKENTHTKSKYANLEAIDTVVRPILKKHGFSLSSDSRTLENGNKLIICWVRHRDGHKERHELDAPPDTTGSKGTANKTGVQATGSTVSYLQRYLIKMIFNVVIKGEDNDGNAERKAKGNDEFADCVEGEATEAWDGWITIGNVQIRQFSCADIKQAALLLDDHICKEKAKKKRMAMVNENLPLLRALASAGHEEIVTRLHSLVDEGR